MAIEFYCGSIVSFDPQQNKYLTCKEKLSVADDMRGTVVACPACDNQVEVPYAAPSGSATPVSGPAIAEVESAPLAELDKQQKPVRNSAAAPKKRVKQPSERTSPSNKQKRSQQPRSEQKRSQQASPAAVAQPDTSLSQSESSLSYASFTSDNMCMHCGSSIHNAVDTCLKCGKALPSHLRKSERTLQPRHKLTGFQLWFAGLISMVDANQKSSSTFNFVLVVPLLFIVGMCIALVTFGGVLGIVIAVPLFAAGLFYGMFILRWFHFKSNPLANLSWIEQQIWLGLLNVCRALKWQNPLESSKKVKVVDTRGSSIADADLRKLDGIADARVLDLTGQQITDQGLLFLHDRKNLHRIVLRDTSVTREGIFHLQQALPRCWIWNDRLAS